MSAALIAQLLITIGPPAVDLLMKLFESGEPVTPEKWNELKKLIQTPFSDLAGPK